MWIYRQTTGGLYRDGQLVGVGYSGAGLGKNSSTFESVHNVGPIPRGFYSINFVGDTEDHGPFVLQLVPDVNNMMFGRSGFLMHGDSALHLGNASRGCIIFERALRETVWTSLDHMLQVTA